MKYLLYILVMAVGIFASAQNAQADPPDIQTTTDPLQASSLMTQPVSITHNWSDFSRQNNNFQQISRSLTGLPNQGCQNTSPLDLIKNPGKIFKQCQKPTTNQTSQSSDPVEYLKFPHLNSGFKVQVSHF